MWDQKGHVYFICPILYIIVPHLPTIIISLISNPNLRWGLLYDTFTWSFRWNYFRTSSRPLLYYINKNQLENVYMSHIIYNCPTFTHHYNIHLSNPHYRWGLIYVTFTCSIRWNYFRTSSPADLQYTNNNQLENVYSKKNGLLDTYRGDFLGWSQQEQGFRCKEVGIICGKKWGKGLSRPSTSTDILTFPRNLTYFY